MVAGFVTASPRSGLRPPGRYGRAVRSLRSRVIAPLRSAVGTFPPRTPPSVDILKPVKLSLFDLSRGGQTTIDNQRPRPVPWLVSTHSTEGTRPCHRVQHVTLVTTFVLTAGLGIGYDRSRRSSTPACMAKATGSTSSSLCARPASVLSWTTGSRIGELANSVDPPRRRFVCSSCATRSSRG